MKQILDGKYLVKVDKDSCIVTIKGEIIWMNKNWEGNGGEVMDAIEPLMLTTQEWFTENNVLNLIKI